MSDQAVPKQYQALLEKYPEYMKAVQAVGETARAQGPLADKTAHLIQMAAAVAIMGETRCVRPPGPCLP
jgi:alkylhydroperoxidase/carboxymuconolactone decarboxylase family protein YurZ